MYTMKNENNNVINGRNLEGINKILSNYTVVQKIDFKFIEEVDYTFLIYGNMYSNVRVESYNATDNTLKVRIGGKFISNYMILPVNNLISFLNRSDEIVSNGYLSHYWFPISFIVDYKSVNSGYVPTEPKPKKPKVTVDNKLNAQTSVIKDNNEKNKAHKPTLNELESFFNDDIDFDTNNNVRKTLNTQTTNNKEKESKIYPKRINANKISDSKKDFLNQIRENQKRNEEKSVNNSVNFEDFYKKIRNAESTIPAHPVNIKLKKLNLPESLIAQINNVKVDDWKYSPRDIRFTNGQYYNIKIKTSDNSCNNELFDIFKYLEVTLEFPFNLTYEAKFLGIDKNKEVLYFANNYTEIIVSIKDIDNTVFITECNN